MFAWVQLIVQIIGMTALILTLIVYYKQLRAMNEQLEASRQQLNATQRGSDAQNILALANFLQAEDVRTASVTVVQSDAI